jgi:hypothetical protein
LSRARPAGLVCRGVAARRRARGLMALGRDAREAPGEPPDLGGRGRRARRADREGALWRPRGREDALGRGEPAAARRARLSRPRGRVARAAGIGVVRDRRAAAPGLVAPCARTTAPRRALGARRAPGRRRSRPPARAISPPTRRTSSSTAGITSGRTRGQLRRRRASYAFASAGGSGRCATGGCRRSTSPTTTLNLTHVAARRRRGEDDGVAESVRTADSLLDRLGAA